MVRILSALLVAALIASMGLYTLMVKESAGRQEALTKLDSMTVLYQSASQQVKFLESYNLSREAALLKSNEEKLELLENLQTAEGIINAYKPAEPTKASDCLDLSPPPELISRLRNQGS